jgi:hypothetical protein
MPVLAMGAQNSLETRFARDIDILVGQHRHDPRWWQRGETRLACFFGAICGRRRLLR